MNKNNYNHMKIELLFFIGIFLPACQTAPSFQIQGKFSSLPKSKEILLSSPSDTHDSLFFTTPIKEDGSFILKGKVKAPRLLVVQLDENNNEIPVFVDNETYHLTENQGKFYFLSERPGSLQNRFIEYLKEANALEESYYRSCIGYDTIQDIHQKAEVSAVLSRKFEETENFRLAGIRKFAGTEIAQYLLWKALFIYKNDYKSFTHAMEALGDSVPDNGMKTSIFNAYRTLQSAQLTGRAPEFSLADQNGRKVALNDFRGRYVLIDFWASWCAPCREKNKELFLHYPELKAKGMEVISISLDENPRQWLKAVREDKVNWIQLNDPEGFKSSKVREAYKVEQVPTVYLIGPTGNIITKNPTIEEIEAIFSLSNQV